MGGAEEDLLCTGQSQKCIRVNKNCYNHVTKQQITKQQINILTNKHDFSLIKITYVRFCSQCYYSMYAYDGFLHRRACYESRTRSVQ